MDSDKHEKWVKRERDSIAQNGTSGDRSPITDGEKLVLVLFFLIILISWIMLP